MRENKMEEYENMKKTSKNQEGKMRQDWWDNLRN